MSDPRAGHIQGRKNRGTDTASGLRVKMATDVAHGRPRTEIRGGGSGLIHDPQDAENGPTFHRQRDPLLSAATDCCPTVTQP